MKKLHGAVLASAVLIVITAHARAESEKQPAPQLKTTRDQASYAIGLNIGRNLKPNTSELNIAALLRGIRDVLTETQPSLTDEQCTAAMAGLEREIAAKMQALGARNKKEGEAFLAANGKKAGVLTLPSGLQYKVLKSGAGPSPKVTDTIQAHYHGTLIDGTVFDSSIERGRPEVLDVNGVIRGWTEALLKMKVGDKWRLFVPSKLAYGNRSASPTIGPHSVLIFDLELVGIE